MNQKEAGSLPSLAQELRAYWRHMSGHRATVGAILFLAVTSGVLQALAIESFHRLLTSVSTSPYRELARFVSLAFLALVAGHLAEELSWWFRGRIECSVRMTLVDLFVRIPWSRVSRTHGSRFQRSFLVEGFEIALGIQGLLRGTASLITMVGLLFVTGLSVPRFAAVVTVGGIGLSVLAGLSRRWGWWARFHRGQLHRQLGRQLAEIWTSLKYSRATEELTHFRARMERGIVEYAVVLRKSLLPQPRFALGFRLLILTGVGLGLGIVLPSQGASAFQEWFVPLAVLYRLVPHALQAHRELNFAHVSYPWLISFAELEAEAAAQAPPPSPVHPVRFRRQLEMNRVTFRHGPDREPVFRSADLRIPYLASVGITGPSGSGKSTLVDLITGLLDPQEGDLRLDGVPYAALDLAEWRRHIGLVLQDPMLFDGTLKENVLWNRREDAARLREAAVRAGVLEFVERLPQGWDTPVGERGGWLSGGQRQRLAIARALYRDPWLLILDEPTSSLDADSREGIFRLVTSLRGQVTLIVLGHDLELLARCDRRYRLAGKAFEEMVPLSTPAREESASFTPAPAIRDTLC